MKAAARSLHSFSENPVIRSAESPPALSFLGGMLLMTAIEANDCEEAELKDLNQEEEALGSQSIR